MAKLLMNPLVSNESITHVASSDKNEFGLDLDGGISPVLVNQAFEQTQAELFREPIMRNWH
jgi:hypothetical protein